MLSRRHGDRGAESGAQALGEFCPEISSTVEAPSVSGVEFAAESRGPFVLLISGEDLA